MIKYLGSKRVLLPIIQTTIQQIAPRGRVLDPFSGTARVGHMLKQAGYSVYAGDMNEYAATLARCYVQADAEDWAIDAARLIRELERIPGKAGYFTHTFCEQSRFFHPHNGEKIDAIREEIEKKSLHPELKAIVLTSLMEAADRVDSTTGIQMSYLKQWANRAHKPLELRIPTLTPKGFERSRAVCADAATWLASTDADICYLDPPYNQHAYRGYYHAWESLIRWDKPEVYGISCKRIDCKTEKSDFNSKVKAKAAFRRLFAAVRAPYLVVSYSNEAFLPMDEMKSLLLAVRPNLSVISIPHKRYIGSQLGIYNPQGEKVGEPTHEHNQEYLFVAH